MANGNPRELLSRLKEASHEKRVVLSQLSHQYAVRSKFFYLSSAFFALVSGGSATAQALRFFEQQWVTTNGPAITAGLAFLSGVTSLLTTYFYPSEATQRLYRGAVEFLSLRESIDLDLNRPRNTDKQLFACYEKSLHRYISLTHDYEPYFAAYHAKSKLPVNPIVVQTPSD